jgi:glycosyltransferase involved in cell wall biosynthesis
LRIVYITDSYPPVINGVSYVVEKLAENMALQGHEVEVITIDSSFKVPRTEIKNGVLIKRFLGARPAGSYHIPSPAIIKEIRKDADVVHVHNFHSVMPLVVALSLKKESDCLAVVTPHYHTMGHHLHSKIAWVPYMRFLKKIIKNFDLVQTVSRFEAETVERDFGVKSIVVENGIPEDVYDYSWTGPKEEVLRILFVGRLEKYKRLDLLLDAASLAREKIKGLPLEVDIVGSGSQEHSIKAKAKSLDLHLNLQKNVPREKLLELYSKASCLVNCSQFEAFSIVTAEALAVGAPVVIVYPWGVNFREYPKASIVQPDPEALAQGILKSNELGSKNTKHVPTWEECGAKMRELVYSKALKLSALRNFRENLNRAR